MTKASGSPLSDYIETLESEIQKQVYLLDNLVGNRNWNEANNQEKYIGGLCKALLLAQAMFVASKKRNDGHR